MKTKLSVQKHEDKTSKDGKDYTRFQTSAGWMSAFDKSTIQELKESEEKGIEIAVEVAEVGNFKNIRKVYKGEEAEGAVAVEKVDGSQQEITPSKKEALKKLVCEVIDLVY